MAQAKQGFLNTPWAQRGAPEKIILLVGGSIAAYLGYKAVKGAIAGFKAQQITATYQTDQQALNIAGQNPSYLDSQYIMFADSLYAAMDSTWYDWGTDEEAVAAVMARMNNDADVNKLILAFGSKDGYSLPEWITGDFDQEDKDYYINDSFARKGINYRF